MSAEPSQNPIIVTDATGTAAKKAKKIEAPIPMKAESASPWTAQVLDVSRFFEDSRDRLQEAFAHASDRFETLRAATVEGGDVLKESQVVALAGLKELNEQIFELAHDEVDRGYDWLKACTEAKTVTELMQVQTDYLRETMEAQLDNAKVLADITARVLKSSFAPMQNGLAQIIDTVRKPG